MKIEHIDFDKFRGILSDASHKIPLNLNDSKRTDLLSCFINALTKRTLNGQVTIPLKLSKDDTDQIYDEILKNCDRHTYEARLRGKWLNYLLYEGDNAGLLKSKSVPLYYQGRQKLAIRISRERWRRYAEFSEICNYFLSEYSLNVNEEADLVCSTIFAIISFSPVPVTHFASRLAWVSLEDIDFQNKTILISPRSTKRFEKRKDVSYVKNRYYLSNISFLHINRLILFYLKKRKGKMKHDTPLFPSDVISRSMGRKFVSNNFRKWVKEITKSYSEHSGRRILPFRMNEISDCIRIRMLEEYPCLTLSCSSGSILFDPIHSADIERYFSNSRFEDLSNDIHLSRIKSPRHSSCIDSLNLQSAKNASFEVEYIWSIHARIKNILGELKCEDNLYKRKMLAERIEGEIQMFMAHSAASEMQPVLANAPLVWSWFCHLLRDRLIKPKTVKTYSSMMFEVLSDIAGENSILDFKNEGDLEELCEEMIFYYESRASARVMKNRLQSFLKFLATCKHKLPQVDLNRPEYRFPDSTQERFILGFREFDALLGRISKLGPHAQTYRVFNILCFFCGLRRNEATRLTLGDISIGKEIDIFIRKSKTAHGRRNIPLSYLIPESYIEEVRAYYKLRKEAGANHEAPFLATSDSAGFLDAGNIASTISKIVKDITGKDLSCHDLRHSFASWLLIRWCILVFGKEAFPSNVEFDTETFSEVELDKLAFLFIGNRPRTKENLAFTPVIPAISRLLGHAGPVITVNTYLHTIEFLQKIIRKSADLQIAFTRAEAAELLQCSYPSVLKYFPKAEGESFKTDEIIGKQIELILRNHRSKI